MAHDAPPALVADVMLHLCADEDDDVASLATFAVGLQLEIDGDRVRDVLRQNMNHPSAEVRLDAARGLACRRDLEGILALRESILTRTPDLLTLDAAARSRSALLADALASACEHAEANGIMFAYRCCEEGPLKNADTASVALSAVQAMVRHDPSVTDAAIFCPLYDVGLAIRISRTGVGEEISLFNALDALPTIN
ncbi:MAG: hypothetical protein EPO13_07140 [Actinomycetota bacterium]|nr:MAG: hypothetical protein EPO13_07140 [Actinomycetota bacterium]